MCALRMCRPEPVVAAIESALTQLVRFFQALTAARSGNSSTEEQQRFLCSVAMEGVEPPPLGPIPDDLVCCPLDVVSFGTKTEMHVHYDARELLTLS